VLTDPLDGLQHLPKMLEGWRFSFGYDNIDGQKFRLVIDTFTVMPTKIGIHVFADNGSKKRGWRAFARHDTVPLPAGHS
jgi:hypothetical protein